MNKKLPLFGVGPIYIGIIFLITAGSIYLSVKGIIPALTFKFLKIPFIIIGVILILLGTYIWYLGAIKSKLDENIRSDKLVTDGIYAYTRNPIYTAFIFIFTGIIIIFNNIYLFVLPFIYYALLTIFMINTEEKWLKEKYGKEYEDYCKKVSRCFTIKK